MNLGNMSRIGILSLVVATAGACSDMNPTDETFETVYGPLQAGGSGSMAGTGGTAAEPSGSLLDTAEWECIGTDARTMLAPRGTATATRIQYRVPIVDFDTLTPVPGLIVQACVTSDCDAYTECEPGSTPGTTEPCAVVSPPPAGSPVYTIDLPYNFVGGLKLTKPGEYAEMDYFFGGPMVGLPEAPPSEGGNIVVGQAIPVLKLRTRERAYREVGVASVDPTRGTLAVRTLNCLRQPATPPAGMTPPPQGQRATGVSVTAVPDVPAGSASWALSQGNVFSPNKLETDGRGVAGFLNAPPVITEVRAVIDGTVYAGASIRVRADVITLAELRPGLDVWGQ